MFDTSAEFNKVYSTDASDLLGGISKIDRATERRFAGNALANLAKIEIAKENAKRGIITQPQQTQSRPSFGDAIFGGLAKGLVGGISNLGSEMAWNNERYGSPSITPYQGTLPSTTTDWAPPPPPPPVPGPQANYSINTTSWA